MEVGFNYNICINTIRILYDIIRIRPGLYATYSAAFSVILKMH